MKVVRYHRRDRAPSDEREALLTELEEVVGLLDFYGSMRLQLIEACVRAGVTWAALGKVLRKDRRTVYAQYRGLERDTS